MRTDKRRVELAWGGLLFGALFALVIAVLILTGVVGPMLWFTFAAMVLLAVSQGWQIRNILRQRQ